MTAAASDTQIGRLELSFFLLEFAVSIEFRWYNCITRLSMTDMWNAVLFPSLIMVLGSNGKLFVANKCNLINPSEGCLLCK